MSDKRIEDVTPDTNVTGVELLPVSDAGTPKSVTVDRVKDFVLSKIAALESASGISLATDGIFIKKDGALKPLSAATLASSVVTSAFGNSDAGTLASTDVIVISKSGVTKTTTVGTLSSYIETAVRGAAIDIWGLSAGAALSSGDKLAVGQTVGGANQSNKVAIGDIVTYVISHLASEATESTSALAATDSIIFVDANGVAKKVLKSNAGLATGDVSFISNQGIPTGGEVARFLDSTGKVVYKGPSIQTSGVVSSGATNMIPTSGCVADNISGMVKSSDGDSKVSGNILRWSANGRAAEATGNLSVRTSVRASSSAADTSVPTELAVATAVEAVNARSVTLDAEETAPLIGDVAIFKTSASAPTVRGGVGFVQSIADQTEDQEVEIPSSKAVVDKIESYPRCKKYSNEAALVSDTNAPNGTFAVAGDNTSNIYYRVINKWFKMTGGTEVTA